MILRLPDVLAVTTLSKKTIYRRMRDGSFPRSVCLGGRSVGWHSEEVDEWIAGLARTEPAPRDADAE